MSSGDIVEGREFTRKIEAFRLEDDQGSEILWVVWPSFTDLVYIGFMMLADQGFGMLVATVKRIAATNMPKKEEKKAAVSASPASPFLAIG